MLIEAMRAGKPRFSFLASAGATLVAALLVLMPVTSSAATTASRPPYSRASVSAAPALRELPRTPAYAKTAGKSGVVLAASTGRPSSIATSGLAARVGEARRGNGVLGQWVVGVLLAMVVALWIALVAVVVRLRFRFAGHGNRP